MRRSHLLLAFSAALLSVAIVACGDDEATTTSKQDPPGLSLVAVEGVGGPRWEPGKDGCIELGRDAAQTVVVNVAVSSFVLRPPGTCGSARQCGTVLLRIDPSADTEALSVSAAQASVAASFAKLGAGSHTFRAELRDADGDPVVDPEAGATLHAEVTLEVKAPGGCGGGADAGSDADPDADNDAGLDADNDAGLDATSDASTEAGSDASAEGGDGGTKPDASDAAASD
jgi:multidrug efflux pump subunit AcrA (membrane-fusion protein)